MVYDRRVEIIKTVEQEQENDEDEDEDEEETEGFRKYDREEFRGDVCVCVCVRGVLG